MQHPTCVRTLGLIMTALLTATTGAQDIRYVNAAAGEGDGLSWEAPYHDLQDALADARAPGSTVTEIWVASGMYIPHVSDATASFELVDGVALYGGFAGTEQSRDQRDWVANPTTLSADIGQDDEVGSGPNWYLNWNIHTANCGHVVDSSGVGPGTIIDGFTLASGHTGPPGTPAGSPLMAGSGVYNVGGSPTIRHCTFTHNLSAFANGGAIFSWNGSPVVRDCTFLENYTHLGDGGGMYIGGTGAAVVEDCTFRYNQAVAGTGAAKGAGFAYNATAPITIARCIFDRNVARPFYAIGDELGYGGGLHNWTAPMTVRDCVFTGNRANYGGGFMTWSEATVINCLFVNNEAVPQPNDPFPENGGTGAAINVIDTGGTITRVINTTIASNEGKKYAVVGAGNAVVSVENSILWGNTATHPEVAGTFRIHIGGNFEVSHSCIDLIFDPPEPGEDPIEPENLPGCIDDDPQFVMPGSDYHLGPGSPCIDAADDSLVPPGVMMDLDGLARFVGQHADMGAYEWDVPPTPCPTDLNGDGVTDAADLAMLLAAWGTSNADADLDGNGTVGASDLAILLAAWGDCG